MLRWLGTLVILGLLALTWVLPGTSLGRRGTEAAARMEAAGAGPFVGQPMPPLALRDLEGEAIPWETLQGHRVLITLERSVDW
ncbi:MAG: hypothetical protein CL910_17115 [Deltaproteobacteria bacterium]|jgi:hypothetical protein|nr:hypothetical protein [Deltaproteobacteria bacterium]